LFGVDPVGQATVEMWNRRAEIELFGTVGSIALHTAPMFANRLTQFPAFAETQRKATPGKWAWLDRELSDGRPFLAGDAFSVADITAAVAAWLGEFFEAERPASLVHVGRWLERVQSRPSWNA
jgi:glutathione S-transferase